MRLQKSGTCGQHFDILVSQPIGYCQQALRTSLRVDMESVTRSLAIEFADEGIRFKRDRSWRREYNPCTGRDARIPEAAKPV